MILMKTAFLLPLTFALSLTFAGAQDRQPPPQITISGSADVKVAPDKVNIRVGVETRNEILDQAVRQNDEHMKSALSFLKSSSVPAKDIQTDFMEVTPEYGNDSWRAKPVIYIVRKSIEINLTNVTSLEAIMTGLLSNGVDHVHAVEFRTTQLRKYRDQARALAVQAAKEKADALCAELGVKRGKPLNINANDWGGVGEFYGYWGGRSFGGYTANSQVSVQSPEGPSDSTSDTLSLGQVRVSASVTVSFAIE